MGMTYREAIETIQAHYPNERYTMLREALDMAMNALKAQEEPRALTLEELDAIYQEKDTHVWPYNRPPYMWMEINPNIRPCRGFWVCWRDIMYCFEGRSPFYVRENYGKTWLIWTAEPTEKQQEEVSWNG